MKNMALQSPLSHAWDRTYSMQGFQERISEDEPTVHLIFGVYLLRGGARRSADRWTRIVETLEMKVSRARSSGLALKVGSHSN